MRGQIRDRKGRVLASVRPSYNVYVTPRLMTADGFARLRSVLGMNGDEAIDVWERLQAPPAPGRDGVVPSAARAAERPVLVAEDISREAMAAIETGVDLPGVKIDSVPRRSYPHGALAAHLLGYMNEISAEELRAKRDEGTHAGDLVGRTGIERQWDGYLRGHPGFKKIVVDRRGLPKTDIRDVIEGPSAQPAVSGNNVVLTVDLDVQKITERALRGVSAAGAVVMDVDTGRILAMASKPSFDPNEMSGHLTPEAEQRLLADRYHPLHDKTVGETYYPGSTFKPVSALAALEDRLVTPEEKTKCHGSYEIARRRFKCTKTHLTVNLHDAIVQSCNVYFYELGARPGMMDRLAKYGADLGLGAPTGLGLNGEEGGFLPTEEWYREQKRKNPKSEGFQIGQSLNAVIGQGSTRVTLLQMATLYAAIANGGKLWLPQIVERVESPDGQVLEEFAPRVRRELAVAPESLAIVRQALVGVVNDPKGTAFKVRSKDPKDVELAGKTGTAQVVTGRGEGGYESATHAWFIGFAPAGRPKIALAVLVEHGGHGGDVAAPLAMEIVHNTFETVMPAERDAPRIGLPRRRAARHARRRGGDHGRGAAMSVVRAIGWKKLRFRFDWTLTVSALAVAALGLINLWSAVHERQSNLFSQQISWLGLGGAVFLAVATLDYRTISRYAYILHGAGVALLIGRARLRQDGGRRTALVRPRPLPRPAVGADAAAHHRRARQVSERLARPRGAHLAAPRHPGRHRQPARAADREAARLRHRVPAAAHLLHHHDDRAPAGEDAGRDHGARDRRRVPDLPAPHARVSAQAVRGLLRPELAGCLPDPPGAQRDRLGTLLRQGVPARHPDPPAPLPRAVDRLSVRGVGGGVGVRGLRRAPARLPRARDLDPEDRGRRARSIRRHRLRRRRGDAVLARAHQRRHGERHAPRRRRDPAARELRRLEHPRRSRPRSGS